MLEEMMPTVALAVQNGNDNFQLTAGERKLISNFRAMRRVAQEAMVDISEQYKRTLPALPVKLTLVGVADSV